MPPAVFPTTTPVTWSIQSLNVGGLSFPAARLRFEVFARTVVAGSQVISENCWLDTAAPLSVVPFCVHDQNLLWQKVPGVTTTWSGQKCDLGQLEIWLPTVQQPFLRGPFSLMAKFAHSDPPGPAVPILIGLEFFLTHQAEFDLRIPPTSSIIRLP
jgi:hypothetical protein